MFGLCFEGCPSALVATESVDWAPTVKLGYQNTELMSEGLSEGTQDEGKQCSCDANVVVKYSRHLVHVLVLWVTLSD